MTRTLDITLDGPGYDPLIDTVDGLPLIERFHGEPTIATWLHTLWGITPGHRSAVSRLTPHDLPRSASYWLHTLWAVEHA